MRVIFNVHGVWSIIEPGTSVDVKKNNLAIALLFQSVPEDQVMQIGNLQTAKEMWDALKTRHLGADRIREARLQTLMGEFESLKMKDQGVIDDFANKLSEYASRAASLGSVIEETKLVKKFLNRLPKRFIHMVASIEHVVDLKTIGYDDVVGRLKAYEERIKDEDSLTEQNQLLFANSDEKAKEKEHRCEHCCCGNSNREDYGRGRGGGRGSGRGRGDGRVQRDKSHVKCYKCNELGHYISECPKWRKDQEANLAEEEAMFG
ncbi:uncharacterized protein LOC143610704 [Bidens hawaiensis]